MSRRHAIGLLGAGAGLGLFAPWAARTLVSAVRAGVAPPRVAFPRGAIIRTVLTDLPPDALGDGATLMHEHLGPSIAEASSSGSSSPLFTSDDDYVALLIDELAQTRADGVSGIVDAVTGRRDDRQLENLRRISRASGMHIVAAGGYYKAPYPDAVGRMTEDDLVEQLAGDASRQRWGALGEIGTSPELHPDERKMLRAVGRAQRRAGIPIFTHTPHEGCAACAVEQLDVFESVGVDPRRVCIGHVTSIRSEQDPHAESARRIAARGAFVGFDTVGRLGSTSLVTDAEKVRMFLALLEAGCEDRILISADFAISPRQRTQLKRNFGPGFSTAIAVFVPKLRFAGVDDATIHRIVVDNPRRFLAFVPAT